MSGVIVSENDDPIRFVDVEIITDLDTSNVLTDINGLYTDMVDFNDQ